MLSNAAGWQVQDYRSLNLGAGPGVVVREFPLKTGFADYLLFVDRRAIGIVEAKAEGMTLSGVIHQSQKYTVGLPDNLPAWHRPLPFYYESTGIETCFTNGLDPDPRNGFGGSPRKIVVCSSQAWESQALVQWLAISIRYNSRLS